MSPEKMRRAAELFAELAELFGGEDAHRDIKPANCATSRRRRPAKPRPAGAHVSDLARRRAERILGE